MTPDWFSASPVLIQDRGGLEELLEMERIILQNAEKSYNSATDERSMNMAYLDMINTKASIASLEGRIKEMADGDTE